jgi:peptidoglycan lytic transglycosylase B
VSAIILCVAAALAMQDAPQPSFADFLAAVRAEALARGIRPEIVDDALRIEAPLPVVIERDRAQAERVLPLEKYVARRLTAKVVRTARARLAQHEKLLGKVSARYGVPASVIVAVWGVESNFGRFSGVRPTIQTLATLAYDPRRSAMFREELFDALKILDSGDVDPAAMRGSWAGALGQPQFMPSSFLLYAQDFDGDGRRDIWTSQPDVFASIANYLAVHGWKKDQPWGREVKAPAALLIRKPDTAPLQTGGCLARRQMSVPLPVATWSKMGVRTVTGGVLPPAERDIPEASLISGNKRHFLVYPNYQAILEYNCVNAYGLSVGLLADASGKESKGAKESKAKRWKARGSKARGSKESKGRRSFATR